MSETAAPAPQWPPRCDICGKPLAEPGALLFSPPSERNECVKSHFCKPCYGLLAGIIMHARLETGTRQ